MSNFIPFVTQDEEATMVVHPSVPSPVPSPPAAPKSKKSAPKQLNLFGQVVAPPKTKTVDVKAHTHNDGTYVAGHKRTVKLNKSSKSVKALKPVFLSPAAAFAKFEKKHGFLAAAESFAGCDKETAKLIKSMLIQDKLDEARGNV